MQHTLDDVVAEVAAVPAGWTATDVSRRAGINRSTLHRISNGAVEPTLSTLRELAIVHGLDMTVQLRPLSDPDAATAARIMLSGSVWPDVVEEPLPGSSDTPGVSPGVLSWIDRLDRIAGAVGSSGDDPATAASLQVLSAAGRASDLRYRQGAVYLRGRRDALRLASAGEASGARWAVSGGPALDLVVPQDGAAGALGGAASSGSPVSPVSPDPADAPDIPGILWLADPADVATAVGLLTDTHRTVADPGRGDVIVVAGGADLLEGAGEVDGVRYVAPVQQIIDCCGLGSVAEQHALRIARSWWR